MGKHKDQTEGRIQPIEATVVSIDLQMEVPHIFGIKSSRIGGRFYDRRKIRE